MLRKFFQFLPALLGASTTAVATKADTPSASPDDLARKAQIEALSDTPEPEQEERKARSVAHLKSRNIPVLDTLPVIASEADSLRRTDQEVAGRALALMIVALKGETGDQQLVNAVIGQFDAMELFTGDEFAFLGADPADPQDRTNFTWRYEGVKTLLWAISLVDDLGPADEIADAAALGNLFADLQKDGLMLRARLRPQSELLDAADLMYRLNWAVTDARVNDRQTPAGTHPGIVYERHYALNWLIGYAGLSWDDMRTDT